MHTCDSLPCKFKSLMRLCLEKQMDASSDKLAPFQHTSSGRHLTAPLAGSFMRDPEVEVLVLLPGLASSPYANHEGCIETQPDQLRHGLQDGYSPRHHNRGRDSESTSLPAQMSNVSNLESVRDVEEGGAAYELRRSMDGAASISRNSTMHGPNSDAEALDMDSPSG